MPPNATTLSAVIPVCRGEVLLPVLIGQLVPALSAIASEFEILLVEDCGGDASWEVIVSLASMEPCVRGIRLSRNYGQQSALLCGIRAARHDLIVTLDDDLQHPVGEIARLVAALGPGDDVVYGVADIVQHGMARALASRLTRFALATAMGAETARHASAFRVFRTRLRDGFAGYSGPSVSIDVLLSWTTSRFANIRVGHAPRAYGKSGYTVSSLFRHALDVMTGFSTWPLQLASLIGFGLVLFGLLAFLFVVVNYALRGSAVPGFAFLASMITIFSGAQLFALGIFGEYMARLYFRGLNKPAYLVRDVTIPHTSPPE